MSSLLLLFSIELRDIGKRHSNRFPKYVAHKCTTCSASAVQLVLTIVADQFATAVPGWKHLMIWSLVGSAPWAN